MTFYLFLEVSQHENFWYLRSKEFYSDKLFLSHFSYTVYSTDDRLSIAWKSRKKQEVNGPAKLPFLKAFFSHRWRFFLKNSESQLPLLHVKLIDFFHLTVEWLSSVVFEHTRTNEKAGERFRVGWCASVEHLSAQRPLVLHSLLSDENSFDVS